MTPQNLTQTTTSLKIVRVLNAPRARVFKALTDPKELAKWFAPGTMRPTITRFDAKVPGTFQITMTGEMGDPGAKPGDYSAGGKFLEVVPNTKIVQTWKWQSSDPKVTNEESRLTWELSDAPGGKTQLTLIHEHLPNADSVKEHTMGWQGCLENLAKLF